MATNPLVQQGVLNRLVASITWNDNPSLNVTSPFLGREGIRLAREGAAVVYLPTMTGAVLSPEPYMMIRMTVNLLKTQALGAAYKTKMEFDSALGDGQVRPDIAVGGISLFQITNCSIADTPELDFSGGSALYPVIISGYYNINQNYWNQ